MKRLSLLLGIAFIFVFGMQANAANKKDNQKTAESVYAFAEEMDANGEMSLDLLKEEMSQLPMKEKTKLVNRAIKEVQIAQETGDLKSGNIAMYILAVLIPPVAVAIETNLGMPTLWNILWTCLGWLPGVIHAFIIIG